MHSVSAKLRQYYKEYTERDIDPSHMEKYEPVLNSILDGKFDDMPMLQFGQYVLNQEKKRKET